MLLPPLLLSLWPSVRPRGVLVLRRASKTPCEARSAGAICCARAYASCDVARSFNQTPALRVDVILEIIKGVIGPL